MAEDLQALYATAATSLNVRHFADEVAAASWVRSTHAALRDLSAALIARQPQTPIGELQRMLDELPALSGRLSGEAGPRLIRDVMPEWIDDLEARVTGKLSSNVPTGFSALDIVMNGGWHRGAFAVVAARPGRGKTTFGLSAAINAAIAGHQTMFATVEMTARDIATKVVSNLARVKSGKFIRGELTDDESDRTMGQMERIGGLPLWIDDAWRGEFEKFVAHCRRLKRRSGLDLVFLDYVGLTKLKGRHDSRREEVEEISKACKLMALELNVAVVALAQLNRRAEDEIVPGKEHIAESDNLGRDPDAVILIYRKPMLAADGSETGEEQTMLSVQKNRWGIERDIPVDADLAFSAFRSASVNLESFNS
jgi:replicative DNA helicase